MKINQINIDGFGKLKDFHIDFKNGFNIIYGNNEDGKSTLMAFVKMMFYGSASLKKNDILRNPRKKYLPKDNTRMSGNIIFENEGITYRLEREFNDSNETDVIKLFSITANRDIPVDNRISIGQMFFGFSASAFEKTFFISQTGTQIDSDDEINKRLANLNSTGDESISTLKVRSRLVSAKEEFKSQSGKTGKLDRRYIKLKEFEELLEKEKRDEAEKVSMMNRASELSEKIKHYEETYKTAVEQIDTQEKLMRLERLKEIASYKKIYDELSKNLSEKQAYLTSDNFTADNDFLSECENRFEDLKNLEHKKLNMLSELQHLEKDLKNCAEGKLIEAEQQNINDIQNKIMHIGLEIRNINDEISSARSKSVVIEEKLKNSEIDYKLSESNFRSIDAIYHQKILLAEKELHDASLPKPMENSEKQEKHNLNIDKKYLGYSIITLAVSIGLSLIIDPMCIFLVILSVIFIIKAVHIKNKDKDKPFEYVNHVEVAKCNERLQKVRNQADGEKMTAKANMDNAKSRIAEFKSAISKIRDKKIPELENKKTDYENEVSELQNEKSQHEIKLAEIQASIKTKNEQILNIKTRLNEIILNQNNKIREILEFFSSYKYVDDINSFYLELNELKELFDEIDRIKIKIEGHLNSAPYLNSSLSVQQVRMQINNLENMLMSKNDNKLPEKIDEHSIENLKKQTSVLLNGINSCKEDYANINAVMKTKFKDSIGISHIEHEINIIRNEIEENEQYCSNLDTALKYLEEASEEMQKNFGSSLNIRTADIFRKLTGGKYNSVIVSEDFNISVKNDSSEVEWQYLSSGTIDQSYFSLRLAVADMLSGKKNTMPVLIDDVFIQYDDIRTKQALDFLDDYSANSQIIFFTCHGHLIDMSAKQNLNVKISKI